MTRAGPALPPSWLTRTILVALLASPVTCAHAVEGPFAGLAGSWSGSGTVTTSAGNERIRCRAAYAIGSSGDTLRQNLRCASESYTIELRSEIENQGGTLAGRWSESTRGVGGSVSGRASPGQIVVHVGGAGFSATVTMSTRGNRQSVSIRSQGGEVSAVSIALSRL